MSMLTILASWGVGINELDKEPSANEVDECLQELKLRPINQESRVIGSLYYFVRSGDNLVFDNSPINREIQLLLGNVLLDEYECMEPI